MGAWHPLPGQANPPPCPSPRLGVGKGFPPFPLPFPGPFRSGKWGDQRGWEWGWVGAEDGRPLQNHGCILQVSPNLSPSLCQLGDGTVPAVPNGVQQ